MFLKSIELQKFGDMVPSAALQNTGVDTPDAGEQAKVSQEEGEKVRPSFDELVAGEYREEFKEKVSDIIRRRFKKEKTAEESPAEKVSAENEKDVKEGENNERAGIRKQVIQDLNAAKEAYPSLDVEKELSNPRFRKLIATPGISIKQAFELVHHEEIVRGAMEYAARVTKENVTSEVAAGVARPLEGACNGACVKLKGDPASLTKEERKEIKKRVRMGEKIIW